MDKYIKIILVMGLVSIQSVIADEIIVSENFVKHPYCDNIKKIVLETKKSSKATLFEILKRNAKEFGGNAVINVNYEVGFFGTKRVEGIIAKCNVKNSPELFVKSSDMVSKTILPVEIK